MFAVRIKKQNLDESEKLFARKLILFFAIGISKS